jgi:predicted RNA-binding Zn-ribbon protein involved in translation (DUF1610 family)
MGCFNDKNQHIGRLVELDRTSVDWDVDAVTRWCPECGAVVVDKEYDCRIVGYYAKMRFPEITRRALTNESI